MKRAASLIALTMGLVWAGAVGFTSAPAAGATDQVVAELPFPFGGGTLLSLYAPQLQITEMTAAKEPIATLVFNLAPSDVGTIAWKDVSDPEVRAFVDGITDGVQGRIRIQFGGGLEGYEPIVLGSQVGPNGIDLQGFVITRVGFRLDAFTEVSPGDDPNGDGDWIQFSGAGSFLFEGHSAVKTDCKHDGWMTLTRADGTGFKSQGDCTQYFNTGG